MNSRVDGDPQPYSGELAFAVRLADAADALSMARFRSPDLRIDRKPDMSPVTDADTEIEKVMRATISAARPGDTVVGEEFDASGSDDAEWRWVIDPIDGTKSYARGNESWATLIALQQHRETVVAVASMPAMRQRYTATRGGGAHLNGEPLSVSAVAAIDGAMLAHTSLSGFIWCDLETQLTRLAGQCWDARGFGNSMSHLAVARGSADIAWTSRAYEWDFAALALIVAEAGGKFTDLAGEPARGGSGLSSNGTLHAEVLALLRD